MRKTFLIMIIAALTMLAAQIPAFCAEDTGAAQAAPGADESVQDTRTTADEEVVEEELPPVQYMLDTEVDTYLGARIANHTGSRRAAEYDLLNTGPTFGFSVFYFPLPHRLDAEFDFIDKVNHDAEVAYAYKDLLVLDFKSRGLWHNLDHFVFPETVQNPVDENPTMDFGVAVNDNRLFMRLKWPENPYHLYVEARDFEKSGDMQQRFLIGTNGAAVFQKHARKREIDWDTQLLRVGLNGHLGPVEVDYSHGIKTFDAAKEVALFDVYAKGGNPSRPAGTFRHNFTPDLERSWDTVKLHTMYTGRIYGNLTFTHGERKNRTNLAHVEYNRAATGWTLIPADHVTIALKYRFDKMRETSPEVMREVDRATKTLARVSPVNEAISPTKNQGNVVVKYQPFKELEIKGEYVLDNTIRRRAYNWRSPGEGIFIPDNTNSHTGKLSVYSRPAKGVDVRGSVGYTYTTDPANPVGSRTNWFGNVNGNWLMRPGLNMNVVYRFAREENPFDFAGQTFDRDRHVARDTAGANLTWTPMGWASTTAYYNYARVKTTASVAFEATVGATVVPFLEHAAPNRDSSHVYGLSADTSFDGPVNFSLDFHQSFSRGEFSFTAHPTIGGNVFNTHDIGAFTDLKTRETGGSVQARYDLRKGWGATFGYTINNYRNLDDHKQDGQLDGTAHSGIAMLTKKW